MFEKVNPAHPDKIADRIAGAIVDLAYKNEPAPRIAVEVLIGHGSGALIIEADNKTVEYLNNSLDLENAVDRIIGSRGYKITVYTGAQDRILAENQGHGKVRCADNGIFKAYPLTEEQKKLSDIARVLFHIYNRDGKYLIDGGKLTICQSCAQEADLRAAFPEAVINPLGYWSGGLEADTGATNRKLASDMGDGAAGGGGLHGKDLSKADVSVNIYAFLKAQETGKPVEISCSIGDEEVDGRPYSEIVSTAYRYIHNLGGFEKLAEWGLI